MQLFDFKEVKYLERDTNTPTLSGTIPSEIGKGGTIIITIGDKTYTTEINKQDGKWSWTPPEGLNDGHYSLSIVVRDKAGNISPPALRTLIIDTTPPEAPQLLMMYDDQGKETGMIHPGDKTDDRRPTLTGVAQKGTIVYLKDGDKIIGSAKADEKTGVWTIEPQQDLSDGPHKLTLVAKETFAGKDRWGDETQAIDIIIGDDAPGVPVIGSVIDDVGTITGNIANGGVTDDKRPTLTGTADANSIVTLFVDGKAAGSVRADSTGRWSLTPLADLADGLHKLTVTASNDKGNSSIETASWDITVNTVAPGTPTITRIHDDYGSKTGDIPDGGRTDDLRPDLFGKAEPGSVVKIYNGDTLLGSVTADDKGDWMWEPEMSGLKFTYGEYNFNVSATDKVGNNSQKSTDWKIIIGGDYKSGLENFEKEDDIDAKDKIIYTTGTGLKWSFVKLAPADNGWVSGILTNQGNTRLHVTNKSIVKLDFGLTNEISFVTGGYGTGNATFKVYTPQGKLIYSGILTKANPILEYQSEEIGYIEVTVADGGGIYIDNVKWGGGETLPVSTDDHKIVNVNDLLSPVIEANDEREEASESGSSSENSNSMIQLINSGLISLADVLTSGEKNLYIDDGKEQMLVKGQAGDKIEFSDLLKDGTDLGDWNQVLGTVTIAGEQYNVYQHSGSDVEVLVQMGVQVELQNH